MCCWIVHLVHPVCLFGLSCVSCTTSLKKVFGLKHTGSPLNLCYDKFSNVVALISNWLYVWLVCAQYGIRDEADCECNMRNKVRGKLA